MNVLDEMSYYWSWQVATDIARKTQVLLESKNDLLYDANTCLSNNWEGLCVQIQDERSVMDWENGILTTRSYFERYYSALPSEEKFTLWTQSDAGQTWIENSENRTADTFDFEQVPTAFEECVKLLLTVLLEMAYEYKNDNIKNFLEYDCRGIEVEEYEEEEDEYEE